MDTLISMKLIKKIVEGGVANMIELYQVTKNLLIILEILVTSQNPSEY